MPAVSPLQPDDRYRSLFNSIDEGFCVIEMVLDQDGRAVDYLFLEANRVFEGQTGLRDVIGRSARELVPDLENFWFDTYGRVALTREPIRFTNGSEPMQRWFDVYAFPVDSPELRRVAILFNDVTERRRLETNLALLAEVSDDLSRLSTLDEVMPVVSARIGTHLGLSACALIEVNDAADRARVDHAWHREGVPDLRGEYRLADFYFAEDFQRAGHAGELFVVDDVKADPRTDESAYAALGIGAFLGVPLVRGGRWRFMLAVYDDKPRKWRPDERALTFELSARIWTRLERARAETALRESEERFRNMADNAPVMVWVTEADGYCSYLNARWYEFTGQSADEGLGLGWLDATHPDDRDATERTFLSANEQRVPFRAEYRLRRRDGTYAWAIDSAVPRLGADGTYLGYIGSVLDISDRKRHETSLRESEERARLALGVARLGTWTWNVATGTVAADERCREICFLEPEASLTLEKVAAHVHPEDWARVETGLMAALDPSGDGTYALEFRFVQPHGETHWVSSRGQVIFSDDERDRRPLMMVGSVLDITDRRLREAELRAANQMKDEFLATLSHELRTPLNAVVGWAHMLRAGTLAPDAQLRAIDSIERNARAQTQLVNDLLDVSRIISGKLQINREAVDLVVLVRGAIETIKPAAAAKGLTVQFTVESSRPVLVTGDADRLRQVTWNLLTNAVKFTPSGGRIDVELGGSGHDAELRVRDTGEGIAASFMPFVFERFRQGDASVTRRHGGLGLGLAIVRHLVEAHGGAIMASSPGRGMGATFTVTLPLSASTSAIPEGTEPGDQRFSRSGENVPSRSDG